MLREFLVFVEQYNLFGIAVSLFVATKVGEVVKGLIDDSLIQPLLNPGLIFGPFFVFLIYMLDMD